MSSRLPPLPTQTHDFAYHATRALSTVNLVPSSPAPRSDESVKEEDNTPRLLTPPLPVKSPRRNVDSPEPPPKRRNVDSPDPPPKRTQAKYATGPLPAPAPPAKPARQPHLQVPTQQTYVSDNCQRLGEQQVALQPLPTSYYAPVFCPSGTVPNMREKQKKKVERKDKKKLRNRQPKAAWHKLRLALRAFVVALLLFGLSMSLWLWPGDFMATSATLVIIYNSIEVLTFALCSRGMNPRIHLWADLILAMILVTFGGLEFAFGDREYYLATLGSLLITAGMAQGCVWGLGLMGFRRARKAMKMGRVQGG